MKWTKEYLVHTMSDVPTHDPGAIFMQHHHRHTSEKTKQMVERNSSAADILFPPSLRVEFKIEIILLCSVKNHISACLKLCPRFVPNVECVSIAYKTKQNRMHISIYHRLDASDFL